jgi:hypothetical protein
MLVAVWCKVWDFHLSEMMVLLITVWPLITNVTDGRAPSISSCKASHIT